MAKLRAASSYLPRSSAAYPLAIPSMLRDGPRQYAAVLRAAIALPSSRAPAKSSITVRSHASRKTKSHGSLPFVSARSLPVRSSCTSSPSRPEYRRASVVTLRANMGTMMLVDSFSFGTPASRFSRAPA